ncbi:OmpA family protein [Enhygromyxa salina]|uniref:Photosystem I P700 chlorophyll a apoprotein A2 n=1 Tax=Enhygromyxa salina TaxID=215803 RepID=A0A2S9YLR4_9BACT|nr:OmpA family protein [Enhygromyxa salina]PRQ05986.1 Photosystem I P700 chlorophyll a apoprotein A2 [Enhygromyxa salina]
MSLINKQRARAVVALVSGATLAVLAACSQYKNNDNDQATARPANEVTPSNEQPLEPRIEPDREQADRATLAPEAELPGVVPGVDWSDPDKVPVQITAVVVDVGLADLCGIERAKAYFEYDSAKLTAEGEQIVAGIAACFDDGPLKGQTLQIVGHTDPRGSDAYNEQLGKSRAETVAEVLREHGVAKRRVETESVGEKQAHPDPDMWPRDRRVELRVGS